MRDYIKSIVNKKLSADDNLNLIREYIQAYFLYVMYRKKYYQDMVFTGGTALRFVYGIRRFSEDIDFSLSVRVKQIDTFAASKPHPSGCGKDTPLSINPERNPGLQAGESRRVDFNVMMHDIAQEFYQAGYTVEIKAKSHLTVNSAILKFSGIMFETGLSPLKDEKFLIKAELDAHPPAGGIEAHTMVSTPFMFYMLHYDLKSLFAGKVHALLCRKYAKGRDWYDLMWYLSKFKDIEPNYIMLNNAMAQTSKNPTLITQDNWKTEIKKVVKTLDWVKVRNDVERFLEDAGDIKLLAPETFINLLESRT